MDLRLAQVRTEQIPQNRYIEVQVSQDLLERAYEKAISIFSDWDLTPPGVHSHLGIDLNCHKLVLDIKHEVVPPLAFALKYFGDGFPRSLIQKLRNKPQTTDTLFELVCLGFFAEHHKVIYEPKLPDGKVPDLRVELDGGPFIYVECKSHRYADAPYVEAFMDVSSQIICDAFTGQPITTAAEQEHSRMEVYLKARPSSREIEQFRKAIPALTMDRVRVECPVTPNIAVMAVPQAQPLRSGASLWNGWQIVGTEPTRIALPDSRVLAYSWPGLDVQRRKLQRALLRDARIQLRNIPAGSLGMICIQTVSAKRFLPDVHALIDQDQFSQVPIIWLKSSRVLGTESKIVFRDGVGHLVERLFPGGAQELRRAASPQ